ncbi:alpha/beta hydrolase [Paraburkholderia sp. DHOC27]|nr:alpha/beta hydrolase [Paraburkholderia sp. DHOC27]
MPYEQLNQDPHCSAPATFVLVHGAWHGGWCYRDTARVLRESGHTVFTPTLTGLGERAHLNSHAITLETHIRDVCGVLEAEELSDVILVGHSYGGMVITGVADRMSDRIKSLVYLDAFVPQHAQSMNDCIRQALSEENATAYLAAFQASAMTGNCGLTSPVPAVAFNVKPDSRAWIDRRCSPQSFASFATPALLTGRESAIKDKLFILAEDWEPSPFPYYAKQVSGKEGWRIVRLSCGHDVMIDMPVELANVLTGTRG